MIYINAFLLCGAICMIAQIIYDHSNLTAGHITSLFVIFGALLDSFHIYDVLIKYCGMGASIPITSFGHSLIHGALKSASEQGVFGLLFGMFDLTAVGISSAILLAFFASIFSSSKNL